MPCTPFTLPGGARGFVCSRTPRPRCACGQPSAFQCDAPTRLDEAETRVKRRGQRREDFEPTPMEPWQAGLL